MIYYYYYYNKKHKLDLKNKIKDHKKLWQKNKEKKRNQKKNDQIEIIILIEKNQKTWYAG